MWWTEKWSGGPTSTKCFKGIKEEFVMLMCFFLHSNVAFSNLYFKIFFLNEKQSNISSSWLKSNIWELYLGIFIK